MDLENCSFVNNHAEKLGDDICVSDGGQLITENEGENNRIGKDISDSGIDCFAPAQGGPFNIAFVESISESDIGNIQTACIVGSFVVGMIAGIITCNPVAGAALGGALGATIGVGGTVYVFTNSFDYRLNRFAHAFILIGGSTVAGIWGGIIGGLIGYMLEPEPFVPLEEVPGAEFDFEAVEVGVRGPGSELADEFSVYEGIILS